MQYLPFNSSQISQTQKKINFWQILENKSAFTEGIIATEVLFLNQFINLKISANFFFATKSPLENFLTNHEYLTPIRTELDYIEQRVILIAKCRQLLVELDKNSQDYGEIENILWLLRFQLYGFAQKLIDEGKILYCLIALREAGILEKETIKEKLTKFAKQNPKFASVISEFL